MSNFLFELKIKEYECLNQKYILNNQILYGFHKENLVLIGCEFCYMIKPEITNNGYRIPVGELINYYEKFKEHISCPAEIARNCWLCPHCMRLFQELIPSFDSIEETNVSI